MQVKRHTKRSPHLNTPPFQRGSKKVVHIDTKCQKMEFYDPHYPLSNGGENGNRIVKRKEPDTEST